MSYNEEQQKWIYEQIQAERRMIQIDREALKKSGRLTDKELSRMQSELEFLREMELDNKVQLSWERGKWRWKNYIKRDYSAPS